MRRSLSSASSPVTSLVIASVWAILTFGLVDRAFATPITYIYQGSPYTMYTASPYTLYDGQVSYPSPGLTFNDYLTITLNLDSDTWGGTTGHVYSFEIWSGPQSGGAYGGYVTTDQSGQILAWGFNATGPGREFDSVCQLDGSGFDDLWGPSFSDGRLLEHAWVTYEAGSRDPAGSWHMVPDSGSTFVLLGVSLFGLAALLQLHRRDATSRTPTHGLLAALLGRWRR